MMPVYEPREDSYLLLKHIKDFAKGAICDMGTGSGILGEEALNFGAVVCVDVNPAALDASKKRNGDKAEYMLSDLFSDVSGTFDLIMFNTPYLPQDPADIEDVGIYGGKEGYEVIIRFLEEAKDHLNEGGVILMLFSSFSKPEVVDKKLDELGYSYSLLDKEHIRFEDLLLYKVSYED